ncbi:DUF960 family protein [Cetobacterium sp. SF1]|uniref:DUF960 family protein n=1 Tax=Cetobacterium sp. SF1 TaxID=3417654 RepID=UPI003CE78093
MSKAFKNQKYITRGIQSTFPIEIQLLLWNMIDSMKVTKKDYLQVFKFKIINKDENLIEIQHSQEKPKYINSINIVMSINESLTIFCIDDITHSTMLLAEEY